eukprot:scaffold290945_cov15-Tisochrysis_lutea.AAC.1
MSKKKAEFLQVLRSIVQEWKVMLKGWLYTSSSSTSEKKTGYSQAMRSTCRDGGGYLQTLRNTTGRHHGRMDERTCKH